MYPVNDFHGILSIRRRFNKESMHYSPAIEPMMHGMPSRCSAVLLQWNIVNANRSSQAIDNMNSVQLG
jgi:hypothetical protein